MWAPELQVLDALSGDSMSLKLIVQLFADDERAKYALGAMLHGGEIRLIDSEGAEVPMWKWREIASASTFPESGFTLDHRLGAETSLRISSVVGPACRAGLPFRWSTPTKDAARQAAPTSLPAS